MSNYTAKNNIDELTNKIKKIRNQIVKQLDSHPDFIRVIIIGNSGVGKSTIANAIIGRMLLIRKNKNQKTLFTMNSPFPIGDTMMPKTTFPNIYADYSTELLVCDTAGFEDARGAEQDILNSFAIEQLFKEACKIKILFAFTEDDTLVQAGKGKNVDNILKILNHMIPNKEELKKCLGIIITNGNEKHNPKTCLENLLSQNPSCYIQEYIRYFLDNLNERVFHFLMH